MRAVIQRVAEARVEVNGEVVGSISRGLMILLGIHRTDTLREVEYLAGKIVGLRIFDDSDGKMNLSLRDVGGEALIVSQFTLWGDCRKGRRPSFIEAAPPDIADPLYQEFIGRVSELGIPTANGLFGHMMQVHLINDGPVTIIMETPNT